MKKLARSVFLVVCACCLVAQAGNVRQHNGWQYYRGGPTTAYGPSYYNSGCGSPCNTCQVSPCVCGSCVTETRVTEERYYHPDGGMRQASQNYNNNNPSFNATIAFGGGTPNIQTQGYDPRVADIDRRLKVVETEVKGLKKSVDDIKVMVREMWQRQQPEPDDAPGG